MLHLLDVQTDRAILTQLKAGNPDPLLAGYGDRLYRSAILLLSDPVEAEDLVQSTVLEAIRSVKRFKERSALYTWLHGILLNLSRTHHRKGKHLVYTDDVPELSVLPAVPLAEEDAAHDHSHVLHALDQLSPDHREVVVLRFYEGLKLREIATQTGTSPGTVKSRLHYALQQLKKNFPECLEPFGSKPHSQVASP